MIVKVSGKIRFMYKTENSHCKRKKNKPKKIKMSLFVDLFEDNILIKSIYKHTIVIRKINAITK